MELVGIAILVVVVAILIVGFFFGAYWLRRHPEKRGGKSATGGLVGGTDFVWNPDAANAAIELDEQQRFVVPAPTPDPEGETGRIRIELL